jgi:ATP-dependent Clp protease protease subunit
MTNANQDAFFVLSGDVNSDMVRRVFEAVGNMLPHATAHATSPATIHLLLQSNGGYVSDGICLYNLLRKLPVDIAMYNAGAVASIAVIVFLAGRHRHASDTARFMIHKSQTSAPPELGPDALQVIVDGLRADDLRTEHILKQHLRLSPQHWSVHACSDLHLTSKEALQVGLIDAIADFTPSKGRRIICI